MKLKLDKFAVETLNKLEDPGLLLVSTNKAGKNNVMTIGWGLIGIFWRTPMFMVAVRPSRYTHDFIEETNEFTVNVPKNGMEEAVEYCGTVSGRTHDKFKECQLTLTKSKQLKTPAIKECTIHYECQVVHKLKINPKQIPTNIKKELYPKPNYHTLYYAKILTVYNQHKSTQASVRLPPRKKFTTQSRPPANNQHTRQK
jgi:flavin reductase (DIM6/NTAB) family NADH-FMN oxidoreductase RutF